MTREEAINILYGIRADNLNLNVIYIKDKYEALGMAIKALKQESVLDKISAEIESLKNANPSYWHRGDMVEREEVFEIIDKYMAESEV